MKVLIVSRTKMGATGRCIGGIAEDETPVRLLNPDGTYFDISAPFQIGDIWDLTYTAEIDLSPPHVENVLLASGSKVGTAPNLSSVLSELPAWSGGINQVFGGVLGFTASNNGFVSHSRGVPAHSTGFWRPDRDLTLRADGRHYDYPGSFNRRRGLSYVGEATAIPAIPAGTLVRVSLARWWKPEDADGDFEERCYLQLSGWF